ncbi:MAG: hypothetical protein ACTS5I_17385 [Rhodanobacter sp.]
MSIPVSTMWQMRSFAPSDLVRTQPEQIRLAGMIEPAPLIIDPARSHLALVLSPRAVGAPDEEYTFSLRTASTYDPRLVPNTDQRWNVLEFDDNGLAAWRKLQPALADIKQHYRSAVFKFEFKTHGTAPAGTDAWIISARLQLAPNQQPLTLLDHVRVKLDDR